MSAPAESDVSLETRAAEPVALAPGEPASGERTQRWDLDMLRILAILGVVAIHIFGLVLGRQDLRGTATWNFAVIADIGSIWCVPLFIMISGALLLDPRLHRAGPTVFYRKRALRILPALVFWHLFYIFVIRIWWLGGAFDLRLELQLLADAKTYTALYFLWLILGLYLVAPVITAFLTQGGAGRARTVSLVAMGWTWSVWAVAGLSAMNGNSRLFLMGALTMWIPYVGVFVAGWAWRRPQASGPRMWVAGLIGVALFVEVVWQWGQRPEQQWLQALLPVGYTGAFVQIATLLFFIAGIDLCARIDLGDRAKRVIRTLSAATFGVFLTHLAVLAVIRKTWPDFVLDPAPVAKVQLYLAVVAISFGISLLLRRVPVLRRIV